MALMDYILGPQNVQQLPVDQQQAARSEGYRRLILGSLLGGRGLASGFEATQQVIPEIQAAQQRQRLGQAVQRSMVPVGTGLTQTQPGSQADLLAQQNADFGQDQVVTSRTVDALQRNPNVPRQLDPNLYLQNITPLVATDPTKALPLIQAGAPRLDSATGVFTDPLTGRILSSLERPGAAPGTATRLSPTGEMSVRALPGAAMAAEIATPVQLRQNQVITGYTREGVPIIGNAPGSVGATAEMAGAERLATGMAEAQTDLVELQAPDGTRYRVPRASLLGITPQPAQQGQPAQPGQPGQPTQPGAVSAVSPAQAARNAIYEPILKSAFDGNAVASKRAGTIQQMRNALNNPNFDTGALTGIKANATNLLSSFGITGDRAQSFLQSATSFRQAVNDLTMGSLADLVGAISNFEINFSQQRFGTITDPTQSNMYALDLLEAADRRRREYYDFVRKNPNPDVQEMWAQSEAGQRSLFEDPKLRKWLPQAPIQSGPNRGKTAHQLPSGEWVVFN